MCFIRTEKNVPKYSLLHLLIICSTTNHTECSKKIIECTYWPRPYNYAVLDYKGRLFLSLKKEFEGSMTDISDSKLKNI